MNGRLTESEASYYHRPFVVVVVVGEIVRNSNVVLVVAVAIVAFL